jgi:alpha-L-fucosidase
VKFRNIRIKELTHQETEQQRDERMQWWREARFGMFVHWGLYSIPAGKWDGDEIKQAAEWIQFHTGVQAKPYSDRLLPQFAPKKQIAQEWADVAAAAGCKYLVFTTKHHEGFALHDSAGSDFDAKDACGRDLVREIVTACRDKNLKTGFYHSVIDWHHPHAYVGMGLPAIRGDTNEGREHQKYVSYLHAQVNELVTNYGPVDILWWDYSSAEVQGDSWRANELMAMVREHQPHVIMNNRLFAKAQTGGTSTEGFDLSQGDFITPEQRIPETGLKGVDWETCMTMNGTWGYSSHDHDWKSTQTLIRNLVDIASKGGNYLLNIGPMADGSVPPESIDRMREIGQWMRINGESIYGTQASPVKAPAWGRITRKAIGPHTTRLYLHVFDWPEDGRLTLESLDRRPKRAFLLADAKHKQLQVASSEQGIVIQGPPLAPDSIVSVIACDIAGAPDGT